MDAKMNFSISDNKIKGKMDVVLQQFDLGDEIKGVKGITGISSGLSVLRDDANTIQLSLPITGSLTNPDVDITDAVKQASSTAAKIGAVTYLVSVVQPIGALVLLANAVDAMASSISFEPIVFKTGSAELLKKTKQGLKQAFQKIKKRDDVFLKICAFADMDETLELARKRGLAVKQYFITTYTLSPSRLIVCQPHKKDLKRDKTGYLPAVELSI